MFFWHFLFLVEAGAEFAITQPVFDSDSFLKFHDSIQDFRIPILAGTWPLASSRNASFLNNEVPGLHVPDEIMERMSSIEGKEAQRQTGIEIARETLEKIKDRLAGIQVSAPFGNIDTALKVIEG